MLSLQTHELFESIRAGNIAKVKELVEASPQLLNEVSISGATPILFALYNGQKQIADLLATKKPLDIFEVASLGKVDRVRELATEDPEIVKAYSREGFQALGLAAYLGQLDAVQLLLEKGANVNAQARNATGFTALTGAVSNGHRAIAELLIAKGANVNHRYEAGFSPLLITAENGDMEMAKLLIAYGADVNARTSDAKTPLSLALEKGHHEMVALLREHGARE